MFLQFLIHTASLLSLPVLSDSGSRRAWYLEAVRMGFMLVTPLVTENHTVVVVSLRETSKLLELVGSYTSEASVQLRNREQWPSVTATLTAWPHTHPSFFISAPHRPREISEVLLFVGPCKTSSCRAILPKFELRGSCTHPPSPIRTKFGMQNTYTVPCQISA